MTLQAAQGIVAEDGALGSAPQARPGQAILDPFARFTRRGDRAKSHGVLGLLGVEGYARDQPSVHHHHPVPRQPEPEGQGVEPAKGVVVQAVEHLPMGRPEFPWVRLALALRPPRPQAVLVVIPAHRPRTALSAQRYHGCRVGALGHQVSHQDELRVGGRRREQVTQLRCATVDVPDDQPMWCAQRTQWCAQGTQFDQAVPQMSVAMAPVQVL